MLTHGARNPVKHAGEVPGFGCSTHTQDGKGEADKTPGVIQDL